MSKRATLPPGTLVGARYEVEAPLGKGGMADVYLVRHIKTDQRFALKVLRDANLNDQMDVRRFRREARAPALIESDHVVRIIDADVNLDGTPFLVMDRLRGRDLESLTNGRALPALEALLYLRQMARALDKAHALGIVHRDLKPENVFLTQREDGTPCVKVLDFGVAKFMGCVRDTVKSTDTGRVPGTPFYMAPEQIRGEAHRIGPHTDVWSFGLVAHRLLTGRDLWTATTIPQLLHQICDGRLPPSSSYGVSLGLAYDAWLDKMLSKEPENRYRTIGLAVDALRYALENPNAVPLEEEAETRVWYSADESQPVIRQDMMATLSMWQARPSLFEDHPGARPLLPSFMRQSAKDLMETTTRALHAMGRPGWISVVVAAVVGFIVVLRTLLMSAFRR